MGRLALLGCVVVGLLLTQGLFAQPRARHAAATAGAARAPGPIARLPRLVGRRDPLTRAHLGRVGAHARELAQAMGLPRDEVRAAFAAGLLHDVGKLRTPHAILGKPGALEPDERAVMQRHPHDGALLLGHDARPPGPLRRTLIEAIRAHHERWDGGGYPHGLSGEEIPLLGRLLAVVDAFDAMTEQRPYNKPRTDAQALQILQQDAGRHFDPALVRAFVELRGRQSADGARP